MNVEVKLEIFEDYERATLEERIISAAAQQLAGSLEDAIENIIREKVITQLTEKVATLFENIIDTPIQTTNRWGEPISEPKTPRAVIMEQAQGYLKEKVRARDGDSNPAYRDKSVTRMEFLARQAIQSEFKTMMEAEIKQLREIARAELTELKALLQTGTNHQA